MNRLTKRGLKAKSMTLKILWLIIHTIFLYIAYTICFDDLVIWVDEIFDIDYSKGNIYRKYCLISAIIVLNNCLSPALRRRISRDKFTSTNCPQPIVPKDISQIKKMGKYLLFVILGNLHLLFIIL